MRRPRIAGEILRLRLPILAVLLAITAAMALGWRHVTFDFSPQAFFQTGGEADRYLDDMDRAFGRSDNLVLVVIRRAEGVLDPAVLRYVQTLTERFQAEPWATRAEGLTTVRVVVPPNSDDDDMRITALGVDLEEPQFAGDPLVDGLFINAARTATAVFVEIDSEYNRISEIAPFMARVESIVADTPRPPGVDAMPYGLPYLRVQAIEILKTDQLVRFPITATLFMIVLLLLFRGRLVAVVAPFAALGLCITWIVGFVGYSGQPVNLLMNVLPMMLLAIGISDTGARSSPTSSAAPPRSSPICPASPSASPARATTAPSPWAGSSRTCSAASCSPPPSSSSP